MPPDRLPSSSITKGRSPHEEVGSCCIHCRLKLNLVPPLQHGHRIPTPWDREFHAVELTVPASGTRSPKGWNSESQKLELAVPKAGTRSPKSWNSRSQRLELGVPRRGNPVGTLFWEITGEDWFLEKSCRVENGVNYPLTFRMGQPICGQDVKRPQPAKVEPTTKSNVNGISKSEIPPLFQYH